MYRLILIVCALVLLALPFMPIAAQIPPTPTPLPPGVPHFTMPSEFSLWGSTSTAIQVWNWIGDAQLIVQGLAIIGLVIAGMFIVWKFVSQLTRSDAEE